MCKIKARVPAPKPKSPRCPPHSKATRRIMGFTQQMQAQPKLSKLMPIHKGETQPISSTPPDFYTKKFPAIPTVIQPRLIQRTTQRTIWHSSQTCSVQIPPDQTRTFVIHSATLTAILHSRTRTLVMQMAIIQRSIFGRLAVKPPREAAKHFSNTSNAGSRIGDLVIPSVSEGPPECPWTYARSFAVCAAG